MEIRINGQQLNANLENEKTVGEVLAGIDQWLKDTGYVFSGFSVDGQQITGSMVDDVFLKDIYSINILDIQTESLASHIFLSLITLLDDITIYENLNFKEKTKFFDTWKESACARFISAQMTDLFSLCVNTFSHGHLSSADLRSIAKERQREVSEPVNEFANITSVLDSICERLIDLPLDIQTGKETQAAQTIQLFTAVTEKILRVFFQLDIQKFLNTDKDQREKIIQQINDFTDILKELLDAYERNDSVLVGDLAEYEASVRIKEIYSAILENCLSASAENVHINRSDK